MKVIKKNVYYCDFCKKKSLKSLKNHEKHCTGNLDRACKLCKEIHNYREIIEKLKSRFKIMIEVFPKLGEDYETEEITWLGEKITGQEIMNLVDGCPICALTVIKGLSDNKNVLRLLGINFDYQKELASWWSETNSLEREHEEFSTMYL